MFYCEVFNMFFELILNLCLIILKILRLCFLMCYYILSCNIDFFVLICKSRVFDFWNIRMNCCIGFNFI